MKTFRSLLFWLHLAAGSLAGVVVLVMSVTGVALTYEKQIVEWADRRAWTAPAAPGRPLAPETLIAQVTASRPELKVTAVTMRSDAAAPVTLTLEGNRALLIDPYDARVIGEPPAGLRAFFRTMTSWHRYLAQDGASRATGRSLTGASNLIFLFIVCSGLYLWLPRMWSWIQFKNVLWFRRGLTPKAREFNWHNVIGVWSAIPLAVIVASGVVMSYPWANKLVYRLKGDVLPAANVPARANPPSETTYTTAGVDRAWTSAQTQLPDWRTMTTRFAASPQAPVVIAVDRGYGGQPQKRITFTIDRGSGVVAKTETFESLSGGRRLRSWLRFAHTGEIYGLTGQTIAGLASLGGALLVYTGLSLAIRRLFGWIKRRRTLPSTFEGSRAA